MELMTPDSTVTRSPHACSACRKHKRRCDKDIPLCGLCRRTGRTCEYRNDHSLDQHATTAAELDVLRARLAELEGRLVGTAGTGTGTGTGSSSSPGVSSFPTTPGGTIDACRPDERRSITNLGHDQHRRKFPATLFLDIDLFILTRPQLPAPNMAIPTDVLAILSQGYAVIDASREYFSTVHTWMPIVSKRRMDLGRSIHNAGSDLAMLFLAMKLVTAETHDEADGPLYSMATRFLISLQSNGVVSLLCLQAMALIAYYEYSHAMYPTAWMTIGACARYAQILGLSWQGSNGSVMSQSTSFTEAEERRRVWWAIFILDRLVSMGSRRPFLLPEPPPDARLPVDDDAWDRGDVTRAIGHAVSTDFQVHQSHYARLCQATVYVGRAVTWARNYRSAINPPTTEVVSLAEEIRGFNQVMGNAVQADGFTPLLAPRCIAHSALFIALDTLTCPEKMELEAGYAAISKAKTEDELALQNLSIRLIYESSEEVHGLANAILAMIGQDICSLQQICPFILDAIYTATLTFRWFLEESGADDVYLLSVTNLDKALKVLGTRWKLGTSYVEMAMSYDVLARTGGNPSR